MSVNEDFMATFTEGLIGLIIDKSLVETGGERIAMVQAAEIIEAFVLMIAVLSRDSAMTETPAKTREWTDRIARRLRSKIAEAKREPALFRTITPGANS